MYLFHGPLLAKVGASRVGHIHQEVVTIVEIRLCQTNGNRDDCVTTEFNITTAPLLHLS